MVISKKTIIFQGFRGGRFSGGGGGGGGRDVSGGPNANFYRSPYNLWFSGGGGGGPNANFYRSPYNLWFSGRGGGGGGGGSGFPIPPLDLHKKITLSFT